MKKGRLEIKGGFLLLIAFIVLFDNTALIVPLALSVAVHEIGHYIFIRLFGGRVNLLSLELVGLNIEYEGMHITYLQEALIAWAGPLLSFILAISAALYGKNTGSQDAYYLAGVSFILGVFNLMPVKQLDGGRALYMLLSWLFGVNTAEVICCIVSCGTIFLLLAAGAVLLIISRWNFTLLVFALWLLAGYCKRERDGIKYNPYT